MKTKLVLFFVLLCFILFGSSDASRIERVFNNDREDNSMDVTDFSIYYDIDTNATIRKMMPRPWYQPGWRLRLPFQGGKCSCEALKCNCCSGMRIPAFNFDRQTCADLTFDPDEGLLHLDVKMNNESVFHRAYSLPRRISSSSSSTLSDSSSLSSSSSSSNTSSDDESNRLGPFASNTQVLIWVCDMCIRLFDITIDLMKMHVCMDWDTRVDKAPVLILHFDCMNLGIDGISLTKPNTNQITGGGTEPPQLNVDVYDPVTENASVTTKHSVFNNSIKYI